ncbi:MAG: LCP family protein [Dorea sp.]|nr:LCP family protein [Dorea sp.]
MKKIAFLKKHKALRITLISLVALFIIVCGLMASIVWNLHKNEVKTVAREQIDTTVPNVSIAEKEQAADDVVNILLVGTDTRDPDAEMGRSDTMMMVSYNKTKNKAVVVSFLRDTLVDIEGHGTTKLTHAYAYGGVGLTINTINDTYDLDIQNYVTISFDNLINVIDEIGGVEVPITAEEADYYHKMGMPNVVEGVNLLTGSQALAHARNRTLGYDFERTRRQRTVLFGIYKKIMTEKKPSNILPLITYCMTQVDTNMSISDLTDLAKDALKNKDMEIESASIPMSGTFEDETYDNMAVLVADFDVNKEYLKDLMYD